MDKAIKKEKTIEAILGLLFCLPAVIGVICFIGNLCTKGDTCDLRSLSGQWDWHNGSGYEGTGASASPTPVYFGLMAIAGAYMLKNSLRYLLLKEDKPEETKKPEA